jgi:RES domain-containing protein
MREDVIKVFPKAPGPGTRLSYTSEHQSLAMLKYFVHFDVDDLAREWVETSNLPANWLESAAPPELARLGYEFAQRGENCLLLVPLVLAPNENNCLINPAHRDYKRIVRARSGAAQL